MNHRKTYLQLRTENKLNKLKLKPYKDWLKALVVMSKLTDNKVHLNYIKVTGDMAKKGMSSITDEKFIDLVSKNIHLMDSIIKTLNHYSKEIKNEMIHIKIVNIVFDSVFKGLMKIPEINT